jgi:hypothetical protein
MTRRSRQPPRKADASSTATLAHTPHTARITMCTDNGADFCCARSSKKPSGSGPPARRSRCRGSGQDPAPRLLRTVCARRFCDQHEISLQTATGRSLPYEMVRTRLALIPLRAR